MHQGNILDKYLSANKVNRTKFAEKLEISRGMLYLLLSQTKLDDDYLKKIKTIFKKDIFTEQVSSLPTVNHNPGVPVYDIDFSAGDVTHFKDFPELVVGYVHFASFKNCVAFVKVKGNSMFPTFTAGDLIGLEPQVDLKHIEYGQPYGIVTKGGNRMVKIIRKGKDNENLILRSNNKEFDDIDLHKEDILNLYKAHGPIRDTFY